MEEGHYDAERCRSPDQTADQTVGHDILQMGNKEEEGRSMHLRIFVID